MRAFVKSIVDNVIQQVETYVFPIRLIVICRSLIAISSLFTLNFTDSFEALNPVRYEHRLHPLFQLSIFNVLSKDLWLAKTICNCILCLVLLGARPRIFYWLHFWVVFSIKHSCIISYGADTINLILTALFIPICYILPVKNAWQIQLSVKHPINFAYKLVGFLSLLTLKLQIALIYGYNVIAKLKYTEWQDGTALYYSLTGNFTGVTGWSGNLIKRIIYTNGVSQLLTWGVLIFEMLMFMAFLFSPKYKRIFLYLAITFHFLIFINQGLFTFFISMTAALLLYLKPGSLFRSNYSGAK